MDYELNSVAYHLTGGKSLVTGCLYEVNGIYILMVKISLRPLHNYLSLNLGGGNVGFAK